jgi:ankyrin repeat protein
MQKTNKTKFEEAVYNNDIESVKKYLKIIDPSASDNYAIRKASNRGYTEVVKLLLSDPRVNPSASQNEAIRDASDRGHAETVKLLLTDHRVDPSVYSNWAIRYASERGHTETVKLLLSDPRVDPSADDNFAIRLASRNGHIETVKLLLSDPRVDFNAIQNQEMKQKILKEEKEKLQKQINTGYGSIEKSSPQIFYGDKHKSKIPKPLIKKIVYGASYEELCSTIPGKFSPVKLLALADLLKVEYNQNTSYAELCGKVKIALLNF